MAAKRMLAAVAAHSGWLPDPLCDRIHAERKCPLLIISGTRDVQSRPAAAEEVRDRFRDQQRRVE